MCDDDGVLTQHQVAFALAFCVKRCSWDNVLISFDHRNEHFSHRSHKESQTSEKIRSRQVWPEVETLTISQTGPPEVFRYDTVPGHGRVRHSPNDGCSQNGWPEEPISPTIGEAQ